jgi:P-type Ca2+ transporter type 2C
VAALQEMTAVTSAVLRDGRTEMGSIAGMLEAIEEEPTPLQSEVGQIGRMLGIAVIIIAVVVVVTVFLISDVRTAADAVTILLLGVSLAVAAVPEGLPAILSVVLALGVQRMASHRASSRSCPLWRRWALPQ